MIGTVVGALRSHSDNSIGLQGELATEIAHSLRARLNPEEKGRLASKPTNNPEAYVLYLQAREKERTALSYEDSVAVDALYGRAVSLDPQFASAMARQSLWNSGMYMESRSQERKNKAQTLAVQALRVAPDLPEAHIALGEWFRIAERNYDAALKEFEIAAHTMPNDPEILESFGLSLPAAGPLARGDGKFPSRAGARSAHSPRRRGVNRSGIARLEDVSEFYMAICWSLPPMTSD